MLNIESGADFPVLRTIRCVLHQSASSSSPRRQPFFTMPNGHSSPERKLFFTTAPAVLHHAQRAFFTRAQALLHHSSSRSSPCPTGILHHLPQADSSPRRQPFFTMPNGYSSPSAAGRFFTTAPAVLHHAQRAFVTICHRQILHLRPCRPSPLPY